MHDLAHPQYTEILRDGMVARWATPADIPAILACYGSAFADQADGPVNTFAINYAHGFLTRNHPAAGVADCAIICDTDNRTVLAATILMHTRINYAGVTIPVGRPEIVASHHSVRGRGLVRHIFAMLHARSDQSGDCLQLIAGIPYFYRQFGYEYAIAYAGSRKIPFSAIPPLPANTSEAYTLRRATPQDSATILQYYARDCARHHDGQRLAITAPIDATYLEWTMNTHADAIDPWVPYVITRSDGSSVGYLFTSRMRWLNHIGVWGIFIEGLPLLDSQFASIARGLIALSTVIPAHESAPPQADTLFFCLGDTHPIYPHCETFPHTHKAADAWYVRIADISRFINLIAPVLLQRMADSAYAEFVGTIAVSCYRDGFDIHISPEQITAHAWPSAQAHPNAQAHYPPLVILQQLLGYRSRQQLQAHYPDVRIAQTIAPLIDILFPTLPTWVVALD